MSDLPRIAWSPAEFAEMVGIPEWSVRKLCRSGDIPATKFGNQWRIGDPYVQQVRNGSVGISARRSA
jgi:excisionase family DNA binding protein